MLTKYFQKIRLTEVGKRRFKALASMPEDARGVLGQWLSELETMPQTLHLGIEKIASTTNVPAYVAGDAVHISLYTLSALGQFGDSVEDFIADAHVAKLLEDESQYSALEHFFAATLPYAKRIYNFDRVSETESNGAPLLRRTSTSVVIKPVFGQDFDYGKMQIADYHPNLINYTTVAQIELLLNSQSDSVAFQVSEGELDRFLSELLAVQAEMKCARSIVDSKLKAETRSTS